MKRFWILFKSQLFAWQKDPLSVLGGFIPPLVMFTAFGLLFGSNLGFSIAVVNQDRGPYGKILRGTFDEVLSPLGSPYYDVQDLDQDQAFKQMNDARIEGVWIIPEDFSQRIRQGDNPQIEMYFTNYNDDRAKNHRLYSAEILWRFYQKIGQPNPPLQLEETYPRPTMIGWFPIIGVGLVLLGVSLGAMFNIFMLTYREQVSKVTLELGLAPLSLLWVLIPKILLALIMGMFTGTGLLGILYLSTGYWPGRFIWEAALLAALVTPLWISLALLLGLKARNFMTGAVAAILSGVIVFFTAGGLSSPTSYPAPLRWIGAVFPNWYAVDPMRELILFRVHPDNLGSILVILLAFSILSLTAGIGITCRTLRHEG
jgi:ABC-type multidrug transport system permease subunit